MKLLIALVTLFSAFCFQTTPKENTSTVVNSLSNTKQTKTTLNFQKQELQVQSVVLSKTSPSDKEKKLAIESFAFELELTHNQTLATVSQKLTDETLKFAVGTKDDEEDKWSYQTKLVERLSRIADQIAKKNTIEIPHDYASMGPGDKAVVHEMVEVAYLFVTQSMEDTAEYEQIQRLPISNIAKGYGDPVTTLRSVDKLEALGLDHSKHITGIMFKWSDVGKKLAKSLPIDVPKSEEEVEIQAKQLNGFMRLGFGAIKITFKMRMKQ